MLRHAPSRRGLAALALAAASACALAAGADDLGTLRDSFEGPRASWREEATDVATTLHAHDRSNRAARDGRASEHFYFTAGAAGSALYFSYPLPKVPVSDDLRVELFVRATRPGMQLLGRVVLPNDVDPETGQPSFVTVPGTIYEAPDRWRRLELDEIPAAVAEQARVLRATRGRAVPTEGAYLERLVVNLYGGPGETEVFLDDLSIRPVPAPPADDDRLPSPPPPATNPGPDADAPRPLPALPGADPDAPTGPTPQPGRRVELARNRLKKDGADWFFTAIDAPGADVGSLRQAGFDVLETRLDADAGELERAVASGFLLMPRLVAGADDPVGTLDGPRALAAAAAFPARSAVAFWNLGEDLGRSPSIAERAAERDRLRSIASTLRRSREEFSPLVAGQAFGMIEDLARAPQNLDILGVTPSNWGTGEEPWLTQLYLSSRRNLAARGNAEQLFWARVWATAHPTARRAVWGEDVPPAWGEPRVQPEQVRLGAYQVVSAGHRGISFKGDAGLTRDGGLDRAMLIELALLNLELDLFEPLLAQGSDPIDKLEAFFLEPPPTASAGGISGRRPPTLPEAQPLNNMQVVNLKTKDRRGSLLVISDQFGGSQFQPPQSAYNNLFVVVPGQDSAQAWEVSPGGIKSLARERVPGGLKVVLPEFDTTALVLVTTDYAFVQALEAAIGRVRPMAAYMALEQARLKYEWVADTNARLATEGFQAKGADGLLEKARESLALAQERYDDLDHANAYDEARRVSRPLRLIMRTHWDKAYLELFRTLKALRGDPDEKAEREARKARRRLEPREPILLAGPVSVPPMVAFNTLPQFWIWLAWIRDAYFGGNLVADGSFEDDEALQQGGWSERGYRWEGLKHSVRSVPGGFGGGRCLRLAVGPEVKGTIDSFPPTIEMPTVAVVSPPISVQAKQFLRISVKVKMPRLVTPGGGLVVRDSIGGEAFEYRGFAPLLKWHEVVLYRRVPADGELTVTLGLAAPSGEVFFDDLQVQRVEDPNAAPPGARGDLARTPRAPAPDPDAPADEEPGVDASAARPDAPTRPRR